MLKILASRFADHAAVIVSPEQNSVFQACLASLSTMEHVEEMMSSQMAAGEDFWNPGSEYLARYRPYNVTNGILQIPVRGVLLHQFPFTTSWATGYEYIWQAYKRGMGDTDVRAIALISNSPGGEVAGCFEAMDRMFAMRGTKPVRAFAHEYAFSAAYAIASAADHIVVSRTGGVGSIGVVTSHISYAKMLENEGLKVTFVKFGKHKTDGNYYEDLSPEAEARIQAKINDLGELFVSKMARNRGKDEKTIRDTEALTYSALEAVQVGLADSVGPLDDALTTYLADLDEAVKTGDEEMAATKEELDAARAEGKAEGMTAGKAEGKAEGAKEGATAARTRIDAIVNSEAGKARPAAALKMATSEKFAGVEAEAIVEMLGDLPEEKAAAPETDPKATTTTTDPKADTSGSQFNQAMKDGKPDVQANTQQKDDDKDSAESVLSMAADMGIPGFRKKAS